jgi:hypothetical protein
MEYGNLSVIMMVIAVVTCVLCISFVGLYFLNKAVNGGAR